MRPFAVLPEPLPVEIFTQVVGSAAHDPGVTDSIADVLRERGWFVSITAEPSGHELRVHTVAISRDDAHLIERLSALRADITNAGLPLRLDRLDSLGPAGKPLLQRSDHGHLRLADTLDGIVVPSFGLMPVPARQRLVLAAGAVLGLLSLVPHDHLNLTRRLSLGLTLLVLAGLAAMGMELGGHGLWAGIRRLATLTGLIAGTASVIVLYQQDQFARTLGVPTSVTIQPADLLGQPLLLSALTAAVSLPSFAALAAIKRARRLGVVPLGYSYAVITLVMLALVLVVAATTNARQAAAALRQGKEPPTGLVRLPRAQPVLIFDKATMWQGSWRRLDLPGADGPVFIDGLSGRVMGPFTEQPPAHMPVDALISPATQHTLPWRAGQTAGLVDATRCQVPSGSPLTLRAMSAHTWLLTANTVMAAVGSIPVTCDQGRLLVQFAH